MKVIPVIACACLAIGLLPAARGAEPNNRIRRVETATKGDVQFGALAIHPTLRKLYAVQQMHYNAQEGGLWVFDFDRQGDLTSTDERVYPLLPEQDKPTSGLVCHCIRFSRDARKLYYAPYAAGLERMLVVRDLDEKGEPAGKPTFESQFFEQPACFSMAVDEKSGRIYISY
jgi:hypothetical protein